MSKLVQEIMNPDVLGFPPEEPAADALGLLLALGASVAPVVNTVNAADGDARAVGVVSWRDLVEAPPGSSVRDRMKTPVVVVRSDALITQAAEAISEHGVHRVFVVDAGGKLVGALSIIDVLRAMTGRVVRHPDWYPHIDPATGVSWTDAEAFDLRAADVAPAAPGVLLVLESAPGEPDAILIAESVPDVRARLLDLLAAPPADRKDLARAFAHPGNLRFRAAAIEDVTKRGAVVRVLRARAERSLRAAMLR